MLNGKMENSILIVDDQRSIRESLAFALSDSYRIYQAANGREAMDIISMNRDITVVVSDYDMPEVSGIELLDMIQNAHTKIGFIFVTGSTSIESAVDAMKRGAFDYMTKPVDLMKLETTIQHAIINHKNDGTLKHKEVVS
jgi:DNA-binding NtrC family response regulator